MPSSPPHPLTVCALAACVQLNVMRASTVSKALHAPMLCYRYEQMLYEILLFEIRPTVVSDFAVLMPFARTRTANARPERAVGGGAFGGSGGCSAQREFWYEGTMSRFLTQLLVIGTWYQH